MYTHSLTHSHTQTLTHTDTHTRRPGRDVTIEEALSLFSHFPFTPLTLRMFSKHGLFTRLERKRKTWRPRKNWVSGPTVTNHVMQGITIRSRWYTSSLAVTLSAQRVRNTSGNKSIYVLRLLDWFAGEGVPSWMCDLYGRVTGNQNEKSGPHNDLNTLPRVAHPEIPHILKGRIVAVDNQTNLLKLIFVDQFFQLELKFLAFFYLRNNVIKQHKTIISYNAERKNCYDLD